MKRIRSVIHNENQELFRNLLKPEKIKFKSILIGFKPYTRLNLARLNPIKFHHLLGLQDIFTTKLP